MTGNTWRRSRADSVAPQQQDWDTIVSELIATQQFALDLSTGSGVHFAMADVTLPQGCLCRLTIEGKLVLASTTTGNIAGMVIQEIPAGTIGAYIRRGRISIADWSAVSDSVTLSAGSDYFMADGGRLSLDVPVTGYVIRVGQAQSETTFDFDMSPPVRL